MGTISLVSTTEELHGRNSSGCGLAIREYGLEIRHADHVAPSVRKTLILSLSTSGDRLVGIVRSRTEAKDLLEICLFRIRHVDKKNSIV
jgi:hypothetical protein